MFADIQSALSARHVMLVVVSKTQPLERVRDIYDQGHRIFGENRPQELADKYATLPHDIQWHLIGHLQTNKVKLVVPFVHMIHSVDSLRLLEEIERQAARHDRVVDCLLQFHIAQEETKYGLTEEEAHALLHTPAYAHMRHVRVCGVMGMASLTDDEAQVRTEFRHLHTIFERLKTACFPQADHFCHLSMGMSGDWRIAVEEGSTMVRIGSAIFG